VANVGHFFMIGEIKATLARKLLHLKDKSFILLRNIHGNVSSKSHPYIR